MFASGKHFGIEPTLKVLQMVRTAFVLLIAVLSIAYYAEAQQVCEELIHSTGGSIDCISEVVKQEYCGPEPDESIYEHCGSPSNCDLECICNSRNMWSMGCSWNRNDANQGTCTMSFGQNGEGKSATYCGYTPWAMSSVLDSADGGNAPIFMYLIFWSFVLLIASVQFCAVIAGFDTKRARCSVVFCYLLWLALLVMDLWTMIAGTNYANWNIWYWTGIGGFAYNLPFFYTLRQSVCMVATFAVVVLPYFRCGCPRCFDCLRCCCCKKKENIINGEIEDLAKAALLENARMPFNRYRFVNFIGFVWASLNFAAYCQYCYTVNLMYSLLPESPEIRYTPLFLTVPLEFSAVYKAKDFPPVMLFVVMYGLLIAVFFALTFQRCIVKQILAKGDHVKGVALSSALILTVIWFCLTVGDLWYMNGTARATAAFSNYMGYAGLWQAVAWMFESYLLLFLPWAYVWYTRFFYGCSLDRQPFLEGEQEAGVLQQERGPTSVNSERAAQPLPLESWTPSQVGSFVTNMGEAYDTYGQKLIFNGVDGKMISDGFVKPEDLEDFGIEPFHARAILRKLQEQNGGKVDETAVV